MRAASGFSRLPDPAEAAREARQAALEHVGMPHTAWVIASHHHAGSLEAIAAELEGMKVIMGTGYGALTEAGESEEEPGLALLLLDDPALQLSFGVAEGVHDQELGERLGAALGRGQAAWIFLDRESGWPESVAQGVAQSCGLVAGAGVAGNWPGPSVLVEGKDVPAGAWAVGLSGATTVEWTLAQALAPLGGYRPVTRLVGDRLFSLGGQPAAKVARETLGEERYQAFVRGALQLYLRVPKGESGKADRLFGVAGVDSKTQALYAPGVEEDTDQLALAVLDGKAAWAEFATQLHALRARCPQPAFGFYVNCCARGRDLYGEMNVDAGLFAAAFPGVPLLGVSGSFELAPQAGGARLCSYTGVLVVVA